MLAARAQVNKINEARQEDQPPPGAQDDARNDRPQIDGEAQSAMNDVRDLEGDSVNHINLEECLCVNDEQGSGSCISAGERAPSSREA